MSSIDGRCRFRDIIAMLYDDSLFSLIIRIVIATILCGILITISLSVYYLVENIVEFYPSIPLPFFGELLKISGLYLIITSTMVFSVFVVKSITILIKYFLDEDWRWQGGRK